MADPYAPIKGKCTWWRETTVEEDRWDRRVKDEDKRVYCSCFVEGKGWTFSTSSLPENCPDNRHCRYYIRHM